MLVRYSRSNSLTFRCISSTTTYFKQPEWDKQRYQRHKQPPYHRLPFFDEAPLKGLPKKLPSISGEWGSLDGDVKLSRYKYEKRLREVPTQFEKIYELFFLENNLWYYTLDVPIKYPEMLGYVKFLTKTTTQAWFPEMCRCDSVSAYLNHTLLDELRFSNRTTINDRDQSSDAYVLRCNRRRSQITTLMEAVYRGFVAAEGCMLGPLNTQIDERATVETFFKRLVDRKLYETNENIAEGVYERLDETKLDSENCIHYRIRSELAWQLRGPSPLTPIFSLDDPRCYENEIFESTYRPEDFELVPTDCYNFSCLPYSQRIDYTEFARTVAGYWSRTPFWEGDPCEFGMIGALDIARNENVLDTIRSTNLSESVKEELLSRHALAEGILTAFAWTSAQAYNQGFTLYNELTYPFFAQLILLDETHIQLLRFQLNSLTSLWKPDDAKLPNNFAWFTPRIQLLSPSTQNADQLVVNEEVISLLRTIFCHPVENITSNRVLRPYLSDESAPRDILVDSTRRSLILTSGESAGTAEKEIITDGLSEKEIDALRSLGLLKSEPKNIRMYTAPRPHPNDVFFYKLTNTRELLDETRSTFPDFGGPFGALPEPYKQKVDQYRIGQRNRQPRSHVQAPPRRWR